MLTFLLKDLVLYISERNDGDFRQTQHIREFLQAQPAIEEENFHLLHLQLENKQQSIVLTNSELFSKQTTQIFVGDAILTNYKKGERETNQTLISMVVGDCFPLIFFDQKSKNIAMIHAGWEPLDLGILDRVWQQMTSLWGVKTKNIWAFLGPGIRAQSYCVASEPRQSQRPEWQQFIKKISFSQKAKGQQQNLDKGQQPNRAKDLHPNEEKEVWQIDLPGFIKDFLTRKGLPQEQLFDSQLDTYQLPDQFFSHRRSQEQLAKGEKPLAQANDGRFLVACQLSLPISASKNFLLT